MTIMTDYRDRVGYAFFGGAGSNAARRIIDRLNPEEYPDVNLFVANTDAKIQKRHFGNENDPNLKRWFEAGCIEIHQLGGKEVSGGRGAGGDPEIGRLAVESSHSTEALTRFFDKNDAVILDGGLGGGTGTGALPAAAKLALKVCEPKKVPVLAFATTPLKDEGLTVKALKALKELQGLVPTIPIRNEDILDIIEGKPLEERKLLTWDDAWAIVNNDSLELQLLLLREIIQETGDIINIDLADYATLLKRGHHIFMGKAKVESTSLDEEEIAAVVNELLLGRFQDTGIIEQARHAICWFHGPFSIAKSLEITREIKKRMAKDNFALEQSIEIRLGIMHQTSDQELWMGLIAAADKLAEANFISSGKTEDMPLHLVASIKEGNAKPPVFTDIACKWDGKRVDVRVPSDKAKQYDKLRLSMATPENKEALEALGLEIMVFAKRSVPPDLPDQYQLPKDNQKILDSIRRTNHQNS